MHPKDKMIHHDVPDKPLEVVGADIFSLYNKNYLSQFLIIKKMDGLSADSLILIYQIIFEEYILSKKIISDVDAYSVSEKFKEFCRNLNIEQAVSLSYQH